MPIPKKIKSRDLLGRAIRTAEKMFRPALVDIPAGTRLKIGSVTTGFNLEKPEPCLLCGIWFRADNIPRDKTFLAEDPAAPQGPGAQLAAFWQDRAYENGHLLAECSNCKFRIESQVAVESRSSTEYTRPKYKFCPQCGKRMAVRNPKGEIVL